MSSNHPYLNRVLLDACARRHEAQKIYLRQAAAQRWIEWRGSVLQGQQPSSSHRRQLRACDERLRMVRDEHCIFSDSPKPYRHILLFCVLLPPLPTPCLLSLSYKDPSTASKKAAFPYHHPAHLGKA